MFTLFTDLSKPINTVRGTKSPDVSHCAIYIFTNKEPTWWATVLMCWKYACVTLSIQSPGGGVAEIEKGTWIHNSSFLWFIKKTAHTNKRLQNLPTGFNDSLKNKFQFWHETKPRHVLIDTQTHTHTTRQKCFFTLKNPPWNCSGLSAAHRSSKFTFCETKGKQVGALCVKKPAAAALCRAIRARDKGGRPCEGPGAESVSIWITRVQPWIERRGDWRRWERRPARPLWRGVMVPCRGRSHSNGRLPVLTDGCSMGLNFNLILIRFTLQAWIQRKCSGLKTAVTPPHAGFVILNIAMRAYLSGVYPWAHRQQAGNNNKAKCRGGGDGWISVPWWTPSVRCKLRRNKVFYLQTEPDPDLTGAHEHRRGANKRAGVTHKCCLTLMSRKWRW